MAKDYTQVNFRIPTSLKEKIDQAAIENDQSITAEIVARLESSFNTSKNLGLPELQLMQSQLKQQAKLLEEQKNMLLEHTKRQVELIERLTEAKKSK